MIGSFSLSGSHVFFLFFVGIVSRQMSFRALTGETLSTPGYDSVVTT